jgi:archaellum biogenesis protein FlaJ (TadC family)
MWKRIPIDDWQIALTLGVFALTFSVFLFVLIRSILMPDSKKKHMENIPFENEENR